MTLAMADHRECDVVVIGGGPAGSTISALLARAGKRTVVLEKERFPRFHIGESLLPLNLPLFDRLGVADDVHRIVFTSRAPSSSPTRTMPPRRFALPTILA
jgi:flavin-dependent dehydrogenase